MKTNDFGYYDFAELIEKATGLDAQQIDIDTLGAWFDQYGRDYWNGECYDASKADEPTGTRSLYPIYDWDEELDQGTIVGYELR